MGDIDCESVMSDKLTCKMSDGTEWEVDDMKSYWPQALNGLVGRQAWLRPINREPREWWNVMWSGHSCPKVQAGRQFNSFDEASEWAATAIGPNSAVMGYEIIKVREVIK